jgi:glycosyltransferase involved in cell wall biosynthesis
VGRGRSIRLKILQIAPFYPPHVGGIESHVEALSRKLAEAGHDVVVYTSNVPRTAKPGVSSGVRVRRFAAPLSPLNNPCMPSLLIQLLRSRDFDVIHAHGHFHTSSTFAVLSNVLRRRPMVLTSHGAILEYRGWKRGVERIFNKSVGWWTLRSVDRVIALTPTQADILQELGAPREKVVVIPSWVEMPRVASPVDVEGFRAAHKLGGKKVVLFVGRLLPVKGLNYLIEAAKYAETRPTVVIIGDEAPGYAGCKESLIQQVKRLGLEEQVLFLGRFAREDLEAAYEAADLFVLPSLGEGLPMALLEAMAHGNCVLATEVPGNRDVIRDGWNGALVEARNPADLAHKIDALLGDNDWRANLGAQARRDVEQNYRADSVIDKTLQVYREVSGV